jgi:ABC-2 type transport system permease protein
MIWTLAGREWRRLFLSPLAWTLLAVVQAMLAWLFLLLIEDYLKVQARLVGVAGGPGVTDLVAAPLFKVAGWLLLSITPLLTMRTFSEERRQGTLALLYSAPLGMAEIVLGKYLALLGFLLIQLLLLALLPLSLLAGADLDLGKLLAGWLGLGLLTGSFMAAGLYCSTLTTQPATAAITTFGLLLLFWIVDLAGQNDETSRGLFGYLSLVRHFDPLLLGVCNSADVAYYLLFSTTFLVLACRRLNNQRLYH